MKLVIGDRTYQVDLMPDGVTVDGEPFGVSVDGFGGTRLATVNGRAIRVDIGEAGEGGTPVTVEGKTYVVRVEGGASVRRAAAPRPAGARQQTAAPAAVKGAVTAQMTGRVVRIEVKAGDTVAAGNLLLILEAMKMENEIRAPRAGTVTEVRVNPGDRVNQGDPLVVLGE